ncbi:LysR family transcriptional regulator [Nonomuraea sp. KM88]|uniref:LysR family transcriptional regulator n=1 Tax=Nonomuraea sp. KM88 TaxID=3457427 RepID=UPI003FCCA6A7
MISDIRHTDLRRVDLNLLVVFSALMSERNATRTGQRIGMSQAAVSGALSRLRTVFHDPLFVRAPGGLAPTPRAVELADQIRPALAALADVICDADGFDPTARPRTFAIGMSDDIETFLVPALVTKFAAECPQVRILVRQTNRYVVGRMLDNGDIDLAVTAAPILSASHRQEPVLRSGYVCVYDPERLSVRTPLSLDDFLSHPHLLVSYDGHRGIVDDILEARGLSRTVVTSITHFAGVISLLKASSAMATIPVHAARVFAATSGLALSPVPIEMPEFTVSLAWHATRAKDPALTWLRHRVREAAGPESTA